MNSRISFNSSLNFLGFLIPSLVGFLAIVFLQDRLPYDLFVTFSFYITLISIIIMGDLGMSRLSSRDSAALRLQKITLDEFKKRFINIIVSTFLISLFFTIALVFFAFLIDLFDRNYELFFLIISSPFHLISFAFRGFLEGQSNYKLVNLIKILFSFCLFGTLIIQILIFEKINLNFITLTLILFRIVSISIIINLYREHFRNIFNFFNKNLINFKILFEAPAISFGGILGAVIILYERSFFEEHFATYYAAFFIAHQLVISIWMIPSSFSLAMYPDLSNQTGQENKKELVKALPLNFIISLLFYALIVSGIYLIDIYSLGILPDSTLRVTFFLFTGALVCSIAQLLNIFLLAQRLYRFIVLYQTLIFAVYLIALNFLGDIKIEYFFLLWNLRYLFDFLFIFSRFTKKT